MKWIVEAVPPEPADEVPTVEVEGDTDLHAYERAREKFSDKTLADAAMLFARPPE